MRQALIALILAGSLAAGRPTLLGQLCSLLASAWSSSTADAGCGLDPSGWCKPVPQTDAGCGLDPDGCPKGS